MDINESSEAIHNADEAVSAVEGDATEGENPPTVFSGEVAAGTVGGKFDNHITTPFAETGLKLPFPDAPRGDGLINRQEGFTVKYRTPVNAGGAYIKMENFNQIINETQTALKETQDKCVTSVNGVAADEAGNVEIPVAGETVKGIVNLATVEETAEGANNLDAITPYALQSAGFRPGFGVFVGAVTASAADRGKTFDDGGGWWLRCAGSERYNKVDFPVLADLLGTTYGPADENTFAIPDFTSRAPIGSGAEFPFGTKIEDTMQKITGVSGHFYGLNIYNDKPGGAFAIIENTRGNAPFAPDPQTGNGIAAISFDSSRVARTSATDHTQTRGLSMYYYIFAGKKATTPAPQDLTAVNLTALSVGLSWLAPVSGGTPASYNVYSSASPFIGYSKVANVTGTTWSDRSAPAATGLRYYKVSAVFDGGRESSLTDYVSAAFLIAPAAPAVEIRGKEVLVTLNVPSYAQGSLQQSSNGTDWVTVREPSGASVALTLPVGTYYFRYRLYIGDVASAWGAASAAININAPLAPVLSINTGAKILSWTNPNNSGKLFEVYRNGALITSVTGLSYQYPSMAGGDVYHVKSFSGGASAQSNNVYYIGRKTFAGTNDGVYVSTDGGGSWTKI